MSGAMIPEHPRGVWHGWSETVPWTGDPGALFARLYGARATAVWLDSARSAYGMGRWSIMGAPETARDHVLSGGSGEAWVQRVLPAQDDAAPAVAVARLRIGADIWDALADRIEAHPVAALGELPFAGGYIGYVGYDAKDIGRREPGAGAIAQLAHVSRFVAIDHERGELTAAAVGPADDEPSARAWIAEALAAAAGAESAPPAPAAPAHPEPLPAARASVSRERYLADLAEVRRWLYAGDSYEACYTYNLRFGFDGDALAAYRRLREANPAPNAAFLRLPGREVLSCSPERYLRVDPEGWAETKPIKGTARRHADAAVDARAAADLAADAKTRAENLMIVDLLRNDLGRISLPGTVEVPRFMAVESYETVHQLVTTVRAKLRPRGAVGVRAAQALFPPGSMTGAPKQRSVELLDGCEAEPRGAYAGVLGLFSRHGAVDLSVVIRTAVIDGGEVSLGTGGAITIDSDPVAELEETIAKSDAVLAVFGVRHPLAGEG